MSISQSIVSPAVIYSQTSLAYNRIQQHLLETRIVYDEATGLCLKCEHEQRTGSFKWRGALSKIRTLQGGQLVVTASTGNHGLAVANAAEIFGITARIYVPENASKKKVEKIRHSGAEVVTVQGDSL